DAELGERLRRVLDRVRRLHPRLGGDAADAQARAAEGRLLLDADDLRPELRGADRGRVPPGAAAEHGNVTVHVALPIRGSDADPIGGWPVAAASPRPAGLGLRAGRDPLAWVSAPPREPPRLVRRRLLVSTTVCLLRSREEVPCSSCLQRSSASLQPPRHGGGV